MNGLVSASIDILRSALLVCCLSSVSQAQHAAPQDLRASAADGAHVVLQWSRPDRYASSYELQRATGDGAFESIRRAIDGMAMTVADTTATVSSIYRYRLLARVAPLDSEYSNELRVTTSASTVRRVWPHEAYLRPAVYGRVLDSLTGLPLPALQFAVRGMPISSGSDSLGRYLLFGVPPGIHELSFFCPAKRLWLGRVFATRSIAVTPQTDSAVDFRIVVRDCDEPPLRTWSDVFEGHYSAGLEESNFTPCVPFGTLADSAYNGFFPPFAWVSFSPAAGKQLRTLPAGANTPAGRGAFVRWRATVTGPGRYGHMDVAMYGMQVTEILEMRAATPADCR